MKVILLATLVFAMQLSVVSPVMADDNRGQADTVIDAFRPSTYFEQTPRDLFVQLGLSTAELVAIYPAEKVASGKWALSSTTRLSQVLNRSLKIIGRVAEIYIIVDVAGRVFVWTAIPANPGSSPAGAYVSGVVHAIPTMTKDKILEIKHNIEAYPQAKN